MKLWWPGVSYANRPNCVNQSKVQRQREPCAHQKWLWPPLGLFNGLVHLVKLFLNLLALLYCGCWLDSFLKSCQLLWQIWILNSQVLERETTQKWGLSCKRVSSEIPILTVYYFCFLTVKTLSSPQYKLGRHVALKEKKKVYSLMCSLIFCVQLRNIAKLRFIGVLCLNFIWPGLCVGFTLFLIVLALLYFLLCWLYCISYCVGRHGLTGDH